MEMMIQPSLSSSICLANPPDEEIDNYLSEHAPIIEKWMMDPNPGKNLIPKSVVISRVGNLSSISFPRSSSQFSTTSCPSASTCSVLKYVYRRMKPQNQYQMVSSCETSINKGSNGFSSAVSSGTKYLTAKENNLFPELQCDVGASNTDKYSSSKLKLDVSANLVSKINKDDLLGNENLSNDTSEKNFCISYLGTHGLHMHGHTRKSDVGKPTSGKKCSRICKSCCRSESTLNLLICDDCDNAFHAWCCHPRVYDIPIDEWFCGPCVKKKQKRLKEIRKLKLQKLTEEALGSKAAEIKISDGDFSSLEIMLLDTEPHKTEVRVGKGFQAAVAEWSGPKSSDSDMVSEALETDISESERVHNSRLQNLCKASPIGNWLQCTEVLRGIRKDIDGPVCGKWRRAPLFEVQSNDWDCFSAVFWDPTHADCAAPQEVETEEVMKQLKSIQMLKTTLNAKGQMLSQPRIRRRPLQGPYNVAHLQGRALQGPSKAAGNQ